MKQGIRYLLGTALVTFSTVFLGCTADTHDKNPDTVQVQVPWFDGTSYTLQKVQLNTVKNMVALQGGAARFLMSPGSSGNQLNGLQPKIHIMRLDDGTYIPEDYLSSQLVTLYAHFEKLADLDVQLGVKSFINNWPRQEVIAVDVQTTDPSGQIGADNAMYTGDYDAFLFLPYNMSNLPFTVNAGVIGHEHFHSLFFQTFIKPAGKKYPYSQPTAHPVAQILKSLGLPLLGDDGDDGNFIPRPVPALTASRDKYHGYLLRALNEGLADVWGWVYSGDSKFVERSAAGYESRNLDYVWPIALTTSQITLMASSSSVDASGNLIVDGSAYQIGTVYAHRLWQSVQDQVSTSGVSEQVARQQLAQGILRAIGKLQTQFTALDDNTKMDPLLPLQLIQNEMPKLKINSNVTQ